MQQDSSDESDVSMDEEPAADSATTADETDTGDVAMIPASTTATASDLQGIDAGAGILDTGTAAASALQTLAADEAAKIKHRNKKLWMRAREQVREQETAAAAKNAAAERMATVTASIIKEAAVVPAPTVSPEVLAMQAAFQLKVSAALAAFAASALTGATNKSTASSANASTPANANLPSDLGAAVDTATSTVVATEEPVASEAPTPLPTPSTRKNTIDVPGSSESTGVCADAVANEDQVVTEVADTSASILIQTAQLADSTAQSDKLSATEVPAPVPTGSTAIPPEPPAILPVVSSQPENTAALSLPASTNNDVPAEMTPELAIPTPNDNDKESTSAETNSFDPTNTTKMALPPPQSLVNVMYPVAATMYPPMQLSTICPMCALQNKTAAECRMMLKHVTPSILLDPTMIASLGFQWPPRPAIMETPVAPAQPQLSTLPVVSRRQTAECKEAHHVACLQTDSADKSLLFSSHRIQAHVRGL